MYVNKVIESLASQLGNDNPSPEQVNFVEQVFFTAHFSHKVTLFFSQKLNELEASCLFWVVSGFSVEEIAKLLRLAVFEVHECKKSMLRKLGATSINELISRCQ